MHSREIYPGGDEYEYERDEPATATQPEGRAPEARTGQDRVPACAVTLTPSALALPRGAQRRPAGGSTIIPDTAARTPRGQGVVGNRDPKLQGNKQIDNEVRQVRED